MKMTRPRKSRNGSHHNRIQPIYQIPWLMVRPPQLSLQDLPFQCKSGGASPELAMSADARKSSATANSLVHIAQSTATVSQPSSLHYEIFKHHGKFF